MAYGGSESSPERLLIFRFLVARGARVSFSDVLEFQMEDVAKCMEDIESSPVQEVRKRVKPIIELAAAQLEVARQQERPAAPPSREKSCSSGPGAPRLPRIARTRTRMTATATATATTRRVSTTTRRGFDAGSRSSRASVSRARSGSGFARRVLDHAFDDGESPRHRTSPWADHEGGLPTCAPALERRRASVVRRAASRR